MYFSNTSQGVWPDILLFCSQNEICTSDDQTTPPFTDEGLIHADDTTILASSREKAEQKFRSMLAYCKLNHISLQISKCEFIVINGNESDHEPLVFEGGKIENVPFLKLLGLSLVYFSAPNFMQSFREKLMTCL